MQFRCFWHVLSQIAFLQIFLFFFVLFFFRGKNWAGWQPPGRLLGDSWVLLKLLGPPGAFWASRASLRAFWGSPGLPGSLPEPSCSFLGVPGAFWRLPGAFGASWEPSGGSGASWGFLVASWVLLEASWGLLGFLGVPGAFWRLPGACLGPLGAFWGPPEHGAPQEAPGGS